MKKEEVEFIKNIKEMKTKVVNKRRLVKGRPLVRKPYFNMQAVERMDSKTFKNFFRYNKGTQNRIAAQLFEKAQASGRLLGTVGKYLPDSFGLEVVVIVVGRLVITIIVPKKPPLGIGPVAQTGKGIVSALSNEDMYDNGIKFKSMFSAQNSKGFRIEKKGKLLADVTVHNLQ